MLRSRSCHSAPPTKVRFYGSKGVDILSAGENDFMVIFHVDQAYMTHIYAIFFVVRYKYFFINLWIECLVYKKVQPLI